MRWSALCAPFAARQMSCAPTSAMRPEPGPLEWAASQLELALHDRADERLTLAEASLRSGYSQDHLALLIREGRIPNAGRRGSPRIRAIDLPVRPASPHQIVVSDHSRVLRGDGPGTAARDADLGDHSSPAEWWPIAGVQSSDRRAPRAGAESRSACRIVGAVPAHANGHAGAAAGSRCATCSGSAADLGRARGDAMGEDGARPRTRRGNGTETGLDPPAPMGGCRFRAWDDSLARRVRQEGEGVGRPDVRCTRRGVAAVPQATRRDLGMDLRRRAKARPANGSPPLRQVASVCGEEGRAAEAHGWPVAPYRRKWATERKHHSLKDVAAAGGWKDTETLLTCYQQPDAETLLAVMNEPRKVRDAALANAPQ